LELIAQYARVFRLFSDQIEPAKEVAVAVMIQQSLETEGDKLAAILGELGKMECGKIFLAAYEQLFLRAHCPKSLGDFFFEFFSRSDAEGFVHRSLKMIFSEKVDLVRKKHAITFVSHFVVHSTAVSGCLALQVLRRLAAADFSLRAHAVRTVSLVVPAALRWAVPQAEIGVQNSQWRPFGTDGQFYRRSFDMAEETEEEVMSEISEFSEDFVFAEFLAVPSPLVGPCSEPEISENRVLAEIRRSAKFREFC
jgi:hypothetical protein